MNNEEFVSEEQTSTVENEIAPEDDSDTSENCVKPLTPINRFRIKSVWVG
jgi:hypothetical protein